MALKRWQEQQQRQQAPSQLQLQRHCCRPLERRLAAVRAMPVTKDPDASLPGGLQLSLAA